MKKRIAMIAAAFMLTFTGITGVAASAAVADTDQIDEKNRVDEQYVVEEDGRTVVYFITYTEPDDVMLEQKVTWYDANGTKFVHIYKVKPEEDGKKSQSDPFDFSSSVTWHDAAGNTYVLDGKTQTVTVYDVNGNVIAVKAA
ncbi:MAG: hypothetical protein IKM72_05740 [Oscillospiraceae bacterium]|nr:hypothetical protein [Oscillospiraceae bacterium]